MKLNRMGWSNYPDGVCRRVEIMSYDGNKYCWVRFVDGPGPEGPRLDYNEQGWLNQKIGYVGRRPYKEDYSDLKPVKAIDRWILAGNNRRDYRPRKRTTSWWVLLPHHHKNIKCGTKEQAVKTAMPLSMEFKTEIEIWQEYRHDSSFGSSFGSGDPHLVVNGNSVVQYNHTRRTTVITSSGEREAMLMPKNLRGYGKVCPVPVKWTSRKRRPLCVNFVGGLHVPA